ncbi:MAG TPA: ribbon-helix-helix protein, CopG family [Dissulfurispiraceae bacterium]
MPISIRLPEKIEKRLDRLAAKTGRSKTYYVTEAIIEHLGDIEDSYLAAKRLEDVMKGKSRTFTLDEARKKLGLDD